MKNKTAVLATLRTTLGGIPAVGDLANLLGTLGTLGAVSGYSRDMETEADLEGFQRVVKAGYDPRETPKLFMMLAEELEKEGIEEPFFFGTHPRLKDRIENYRGLLAELTPSQGQGVKNPKTFNRKIRRLLLVNADLDLKAGRFGTAQRGVERYISLRPKDARAYYLLGEIYRQRGADGDLQEAKKRYKKAMSLSPGYADPHKGMGMVHYKEGKNRLARKSLKSYLSLAPRAEDRAYIQQYIQQLK